MDLDCTASQNIFRLEITHRISCLLGEDKFYIRGSSKDHPKVNCDFSETFCWLLF